MTPLHWAVEKAHIPVIQALLKQAADVHCQNKVSVHQSLLNVKLYMFEKIVH